METTDQVMLDLQAAAECKDQAHIFDDPAWKVVDLDMSVSEDDEEMQAERGDDMLDVDDDGNLRDLHYTERYEVTLYQLSTEERRWVDMGPGIATLESGMYASRAIVRMANTHRILAHWKIFGGMKVVRFLTTVIVVVITSDEDGSQKVISYGLKVRTLQEARDLAILLSSNTHGMQVNFERIVPKISAEQRAKILENMTDRLIVLQRRLGVSNNNSELSSQVDSELAAMLSMGVELTP